MANDTSADIAAAFAEITRAIAHAEDLESTLGRICHFAVLSVDGCHDAGVTVREDGAAKLFVTKGATSGLVIDVDQAQYELGEGPCVAAAESEEEQHAPDLASDERWPHFGPYAAQRGVASLLSLPLHVPEAQSASIGALNLYGRQPDAFTSRDRSVALVLAAHASIALTRVRSASELRQENADLVEALESRDVIGQAKGILMERYRLTADEAFDMLRKASQHLNVKLRKVAQDLSDTGVFPPPGSSPGPSRRRGGPEDL